MKPERAFIAERALARHCPELLSRGPDHSLLQPLFSRMGERLARRLAGALAPLLGGEAPLIRAAPMTEGTLATLRENAGAPLAANSLFAVGAAQAPLLVTVDAAAVLQIVDRAYGGKGIAPRPLPETFPMAAELMIARLEALVAAQIAAALDAVTEGDPAMTGARAITPQRRDGSLAQLAPFAEDQPLALLALEVEEAGAPLWGITLALPIAALPTLFGMAGAPRPPRRKPEQAALSAPFADLSLTLSAIVVDMVLPFSTVAALAVGEVLPVAVLRSIPLTIGERAIAHGTMGIFDENVAIQITSAFPA